MDAEINTERSTLFLAIVTLVIVGFGLVLGLWQTIERQEEAMREHILLTSRAVLQAVESSLRRGNFFHLGRQRVITPDTMDFFVELEQSSDIIAVSIVDVNGQKILEFLPQDQKDEIKFSPEALQQMQHNGEWGGDIQVGGKEAFVYAKRFASMFGPYGKPGVQHNEVPFLAVALDIAKQQAVYKSFKQNLQFQTVYILLAAVVLWGLSISFLKRRALAGRAVVLERFQAKLLDNLPDGLILLGEKGKIEAANPAAHRVLQMPKGSLVGRPFSILPSDVAQCFLPEKANRQGAGAWRQCKFGGAHLEILVLPFDVMESEYTEQLILIRDRTEIRELEKNLSDAEKLATLGTLAAGVAHEIRNPLSSLRGFAQYFAKKFAGKHPEETYAQTMVLESDRLNRVITDLLDLARPKQVEPKMVDLAELVGELKNLISFDFEEVGASLDCELETRSVFADEDSLKRALLNLIINSLESFTDDKQQNRVIGLFSHTGDNGVWITVKDEGCGMSEKEKKQAFEPFFTAKPKGTGLGLALVHKTMREHDGKVSLDSVSGKGTTISMFFPNPRPALQRGQ